MVHLSNLFRALKSSRRAQLVSSVLLGSLLLSVLVITPRLVRGATTGVSITEFPIPTAASSPVGIASGPDGNLWFTESGVNNIGRITPTGTISEFPIPTAGATAESIASGPDGNLWFTETGTNNIGTITPTGTVTEFPILSSDTEPFIIASGPDGNLWFTELTNNSIGRITPAGIVTEYPIPTGGSVPIGIASGPDGNLWFTESSTNANKIGRITPAGVITEFPVPSTNSQPYLIASGSDGNLWFTEFAGNKIGSITPAGSFSEYPIPTAGSQPQGIASGPDGNLWFTESNATANKIGSITPAGSINEYPIPTASSVPVGIASGSDGNLWFTENSGTGNAIGQVTFVVPPTPTPTATPLPHLFGYPVDISTVAWKNGYDSHTPQTDIQPCYGMPYNQIWDAGQEYGFPATQTATGNWDNNTPVYAVADGTVLYSSQTGSGGTTSYPGGVVIIEHALPDGTVIYSMYADLDPAKILVAASTSSTEIKVTKGQQIAGGLIPQASVDKRTGVLVDNTHLHWEMRYFYDGSDIKQAPAYKQSCADVPGPGYTFNSNDALAHPDNFQAVVGKSKGSLIYNTYHWTNPESFVQTH